MADRVFRDRRDAGRVLAGHYFHTWLADEFDAVVHVDETPAVQPLERTSGWERGEMPETYPFTV